VRSIQTKFIVLILSCILLCAVVIGGAGLVSSKKVVDEDSVQIMNLLCSEKAAEVNSLFASIEQSVETLSAYTLERLESVERLKNDNAYVEEYTKELEAVAVNAANNTDGAIAVYVRYNPQFMPPTSGLFWSKTSAYGSFEQLVPTDFSGYSPDDIDHVGWYYIPVDNGKPTWMAPYLNQNIHVRMISYVIPIYKDNETVGVVGMDIDFDLITQSVAEMQVYESGYAFLVDKGGNVMYHETLPYGVHMEDADSSLHPVVSELENDTSGNTLFQYNWKGESKKMAFRSLSNDMRLAITAPVAEIDAAKNGLLWQMTVAGILILGFAVVITTLLTRRIIKPLRELNEAAKKIAEGDLGISLTHKSRDEIGTLSESFRQTVNHLKKYIDYINGLAYRDSLTGVKNKTAYQDAVKRIEEQMRTERANFAVVVLDLNGLKRVNDTYGHDFGDMMIIEACRIICRTFKRSPVYRIGGDEFVVILENDDFDNYQELLRGLEISIDEYNRSSGKEEKISIARGIAIYDMEIDLIFGNVFKRADEAMYRNKAMMKQFYMNEKNKPKDV